MLQTYTGCKKVLFKIYSISSSVMGGLSSNSSSCRSTARSLADASIGSGEGTGIEERYRKTLNIVNNKTSH